MEQKSHISLAILRYAAVGLVALCTAYVALDQREPGVVRGHGMYDHYVYTFGWPIVAGSHQVSEPILANPPKGMDRIEYWNFSWLWVAFDAIVFATIAACSFVIALWLPRIQRRRFSLSTLFVAMTIAALAMLLWPLEFDAMRRLFSSIFSSVGSYHPVTLYSLWISVPVLCGLTCVSIVMSSLIGRLTRRLTWFLRRGPTGTPSLFVQTTNLW